MQHTNCGLICCMRLQICKLNLPDLAFDTIQYSYQASGKIDDWHRSPVLPDLSQELHAMPSKKSKQRWSLNSHLNKRSFVDMGPWRAFVFEFWSWVLDLNLKILNLKIEFGKSIVSLQQNLKIKLSVVLENWLDNSKQLLVIWFSNGIFWIWIWNWRTWI